MKQLFQFVSFCLLITSCTQQNPAKLTVVLYDNQNAHFEEKIDTLCKLKEIDNSNGAVNLYFASKNFSMPFYLPTNGLFKDAIKDKECNMSLYPGTVKCYEYDSKGRVSMMSVEGSGTTNQFKYEYNKKGQVTKIESFSSTFVLEYNSDDNLSMLQETHETFTKKLVFKYY